MSRSTTGRSAPHPSVTGNLISSKRRAASMECHDKGRARIQQIRSRARNERELVRKLQVECNTPGARHLLKQALETFDLVEQFFFCREVLRERRAPAQLSRWLDYAEECLQNAIKQREFYETMLERYRLTVTLSPECAALTADSAADQGSTSRGASFPGRQRAKSPASRLKLAVR
jgi:hypothetical protein